MRSKWLAPVCIVFMLFFTVLLYNQLPAQVPIHWNIAGQVDRTADRAVGAFLSPGIALGLWLLLLTLPRIDPRRENYKLFASTYQTLINLILIFLAVLHVMTLGAALGWNIPVAQVVLVGVGLLIALLGNLLGRVQPNWFVGIRTPWTLSDPEVWKQTHRLGGRTFVAAGLLAALVGLLVPPPIGPALFIIIVMVGTLVPVLYSYIFWRRLHTSAETSQP